MAFLTGWRIALAADLLLEPDATIASVARQVGYATPFALSAAVQARARHQPARPPRAGGLGRSLPARWPVEERERGSMSTAEFGEYVAARWPRLVRDGGAARLHSARGRGRRPVGADQASGDVVEGASAPTTGTPTCTGSWRQVRLGDPRLLWTGTFGLGDVLRHRYVQLLVAAGEHVRHDRYEFVPTVLAPCWPVRILRRRCDGHAGTYRHADSHEAIRQSRARLKSSG